MEFKECRLIYCKESLKTSLTLESFELIQDESSVLVCFPGIEVGILNHRQIEYIRLDSKEAFEEFLNRSKEKGTRLSGSRLILLINKEYVGFLDRELQELMTNKGIPVIMEEHINHCEKGSLENLINIVNVLRSEKGCPWDKKQTRKSLRPYVIEEAYEVLEAIDKGSVDDLCEELGDLLLQVLFHLSIAEENDEFTFKEVLLKLEDKLIRRHPHVFGDLQVENENQVMKNWNEIKKKEKEQGQKESKVLKDSKHLPALIRAEKIQSQAGKVGFDWESVDGAMGKMKEELRELENAYTKGEQEKIEEEVGDLLFSVVNVSRFMNVSPELSLGKTIDKFYRRFSYIEDDIRDRKMDISDFELKDLDNLWEKAKKSGF